MPYKDPAKQREYQRRAVAAKRARFTADAFCADCGSTERLELDHRDKAQKESHRIWSWSDARIAAEIAKCDWRCHDCHVERHRQERISHGRSRYRAGCRCEICVGAKAWANARYRLQVQRRGPDSNGRTRLCRALRSHSATSPEDTQPYRTPQEDIVSTHVIAALVADHPSHTPEVEALEISDIGRGAVRLVRDDGAIMEVDTSELLVVVQALAREQGARAPKAA